MEEVLKEAQWLAENGVTELIVIAQDTTRYGEDLYGEPKLPELLEKLSEIEGIKWIRTLYCYPERITDKLLETIADNGKLIKYLDIPIQHCNGEILSRMNRWGDKERLSQLMAHIRKKVPDIVLRTTLITGFPGETEEQLREPQNMRKLLSKVLPNPDNVELIRQRVYTHNARLAQRFRIDRVLLAGDAAHIMPVWQGQGYNSGMRDAFNLAWKLALVIQGKARDALLDTYQQERRDHAKAMIDLSVTAGNVLAPPKRWQGTLRDGVSWLLNYLPPVKRYFLEMRFKPMPQYREGALLTDGASITSPVGKMFIQPQVTLESGESVLLDDVIGANFAIIGWGCNPQWGLDAGQIARWRAIGVRFIQVVPEVQIHREQDNAPGTLRVGDTQNRLKSWFALHNTAIAVVRPDRFVAALAIPQTLGAQLTALAEKMTLAIEETAHAEEKVA
mgnify:CR=1 FL=1